MPNNMTKFNEAKDLLVSAKEELASYKRGVEHAAERLASARSDLDAADARRGETRERFQDIILSGPVGGEAAAHEEMWKAEKEYEFLKQRFDVLSEHTNSRGTFEDDRKASEMQDRVNSLSAKVWKEVAELEAQSFTEEHLQPLLRAFVAAEISSVTMSGRPWQFGSWVQDLFRKNTLVAGEPEGVRERTALRAQLATKYGLPGR